MYSSAAALLRVNVISASPATGGHRTLAGSNDTVTPGRVTCGRYVSVRRLTLVRVLVTVSVPASRPIAIEAWLS